MFLASNWLFWIIFGFFESNLRNKWRNKTNGVCGNWNLGTSFWYFYENSTENGKCRHIFDVNSIEKKINVGAVKLYFLFKTCKGNPFLRNVRIDLDRHFKNRQQFYKWKSSENNLISKKKITDFSQQPWAPSWPGSVLGPYSVQIRLL